MAGSRDALLVAVLLLLLVSSLFVLAEGKAARAAPEPPDIAAGRALQGFHVAAAAAPGADIAADGAARRPIRRRRRAGRGRGGGTGAWAFSAMLPRGFVPPSGSSACQNDVPAADAQFTMCSGAGSP